VETRINRVMYSVLGAMSALSVAVIVATIFG